MIILINYIKGGSDRTGLGHDVPSRSAAIRAYLL